MADDSERAKKRAMGQCNFLCMTMLAAAAIGCGLSATGWCSFVKREIHFKTNTTAASICAAYNVSTNQCTNLAENHGVGFYGWMGTVPVNQQVCFSYTQWVQDVGYVTPTVDTKFNAAKGFAFVADFFGVLAFFTLMFASCCPLSPGRVAGLSFYFFIATLFQGLTLLIFKSNVCQAGFFAPYFVGYPLLTNQVQSVTCSLDKGANLCIAATVLYFFCMLLAPGAVPPPPVGMSDIYDRDVGGGGAAAAAGERKEFANEP